MGKGVLLILAASLMAATTVLYQSQRTAFETQQAQSEDQAKVLAREIARSGYNAAASRARELAENGVKIEDIVLSIDGMRGSYEGGTYKVNAKTIPGETYSITARGKYNQAVYRIGDKQTRSNLFEVPGENGSGDLSCENGCTLEADFIESQAGYCSAIYLQRIQPGKSESEQPDPEMLFAPGNNRNDSTTTNESTIEAGERMNFILSVDKDCSHEGQKNLAFDGSAYDHHRLALVESSGDLKDLAESQWVISEQNNAESGVWRISFEDRPRHFNGYHYSDAKLNDVKKNGYSENGRPSDWNGNTYGGEGWETDNRNYDYTGAPLPYSSDAGYVQLQDFGNIPDFSDQVIQVELSSTSS
jgi:hypothetical protein